MTRKELTIFYVTSIGITLILIFLRATNQIDTAQLINLIITAILLLVTTIYVVRTAEIASATRKQAEASVKMAEEMKNQRYDMVLPIIDIQRVESPNSLIREGLCIEEGKSPVYLSCKITNVGIGPAIDVNILTSKSNGDSEKQELGTLVIKDEFVVDILIQKNQYSEYLAIRYKDIYGRFLSSQRPIFSEQGNNSFSLGPLKIEHITGERIS